MNTIYTICYVSKVTTGLVATALEELFTYSTTFNNSNGIKGILLMANGNFFQVLEGEKQTVINLYEKIKLDHRHESIYEVFHKPVQKAVFKDYNSTFNTIKTWDELQKIKSYLDANPYDTTSEKLSRLLTPFLLMEEL